MAGIKEELAKKAESYKGREKVDEIHEHCGFD